ncbi:MAG TPA: HlyD family efflux transporter periplasmic adaptor subunit [Deltaproteobacteria bacterium]|nr:HlyD family efflux transporter periplasmic adaptor subunit [Deltaproteobacteria bacterium]
MTPRQLFVSSATLLAFPLLGPPSIAEAQTLRSGISLSGVIQPADTLRVQSSVPGRVLEIKAKENDRVAEDQVLLVLKSTVQAQQVEVAELQVRINQNNLQDREQQKQLAALQVEVNRNNLQDRQRQLELARTQVSANANNVEDRKQQAEQAKLQIEVNRNNLKDRQQQAEQAKLQIEVNRNSLLDRKKQVDQATLQIEVNRNNLSNQQKQLDLLLVQVEVAENSLKDQQTNLKDIERRLKDEQAPYDQGSSTQSQLDSLQLQFARGQFAVENAKLGVKRAKQEQIRGKTTLANSQLALKRSEQDATRSELGVTNSEIALKRSEQDSKRMGLATTNAELALKRSQQDLKRMELAVRNAELTLKRSESDVTGAKLAVKNAKLTLKRSGQDLKRSTLGLESAKLQVQLAEKEVVIRKDSLADRTIHAKISGFVSRKLVEPGEVIGSGAPLFELVNLDEVEIQVQVPEEDLGQVHDGQSVVFTTPGYPGREFSGKVNRVGLQADAQTKQFPVYMRAANPELVLRAGMTARIYFHNP